MSVDQASNRLPRGAGITLRRISLGQLTNVLPIRADLEQRPGVPQPPGPTTATNSSLSKDKTGQAGIRS